METSKQKRSNNNNNNDNNKINNKYNFPSHYVRIGETGCLFDGPNLYKTQKLGPIFKPLKMATYSMTSQEAASHGQTKIISIDLFVV